MRLGKVKVAAKHFGLQVTGRIRHRSAAAFE